MITTESINELKDRLNIVDVIGGIIKLKKQGVDFVAPCPFHTEKSPSFTVSPAKRIYKCFGCGRSGDSVSFVMEHEHKSFIETIRYLASQINFTLEEDKPNKVYATPPARLEILEKKTIEYFEKTRKISNNTLLRFKVTEAVEYMPKAKKEIPVICFNYIRDGLLVNTKFRGKDHDYKMVKGAELIFYNLDSIKEETDCIIVEGEVDAMSLYEAGFYNVISVPNGGAVNADGMKYLDNCYDYFENKTKIILATDGDAVGLGLRDELARRLGKDKCYRVEYPKEPIVIDGKTNVLRPCKDSNEVLVNFGKQALKDMIITCKEFPIEDVLTVGDDLIEDVYNYWYNGFPIGVAVGIRGFDNLLRLQSGQYTTVTGIPGSGKSEFVDEIIGKTIINHEWGWGICSFENQPASIHVTKIIQKIAGRAFAQRQNTADRMSFTEFESSLFKTHQFVTFININKADVTIDGILDKFYELVKRRGKKAFVIDPWNYVEQNKPNGITETNYISECLTKIHLFCIKTNTHVILVAHPTKLKKEANGMYEVPTMYSISGSAHFFNKTDNGISVYRDFKTGLITVYVQKVRFEWNGHIGFCGFNYNVQTRQYQAENTMMPAINALTPVTYSGKQFDEPD